MTTPTNLKRVIVLLFFLPFLFPLSAQQSKTDSLLNLVKKGTIDQQLEALSKLVDEYLDSDAPKGKALANQQLKLAKDNHKVKWEADATGNLGTYYFQQGIVDTAEILYTKAIELYNQAKEPDNAAIMHVQLSSAQKLAYKFDKAIENLQGALTYFKGEKNEDRESQILANIGAVYNEMGNNTKHDEYTLQALAIQERIGSKRPMGISLINMCLSMSAQARWDEAVKYGERSIKVFREIDNPFLVGATLVRTASAMASSSDDSKVLSYSKEAMTIAEKIGNTHLKEEVLRLQSDFYLKKKKYPDAQTAAFKALELADTTNKSNLRFLYDLLATTSIYSNDQENALKYYKKYVDINNESKNKEWSDKISEMEVKYQTEKKNQQIAFLKQQRKVYFGIGASIVLVVILLLLVTYYRYKIENHRKEIAEQKVIHLEQEKQLIAAKSVLEGEESERTRLAGDLHDGLGGLLTGLKLRLSTMKDNVVMTSDNVTKFNSALDLLDTSISEMRRVAHNLMPETLLHYGITTALNDFVKQLGPGEQTHVYLSCFGEELRFNKELEITAYRIAQELINNAVKHSKAERIDVQLFVEQARLCIQVIDNGVGFDPAKLDPATSGKGLKSIRDRAIAFNGHFEFDSQPGKGTESIIEFFPKQEG